MKNYRRYPEYKDSGIEWLGEIPAHWEAVQLRRVVKSIRNGTTANQIEHGQTNYPVTRIETISEGTVDLNKVGYVEYVPDLEHYRLQRGDVLFSHINSLPMIGNCALYELDNPLFAGMNLLRLRPNHIVTGHWLWNWMRSSFVRQTVRSRAKPSINQASLPIGSLKEICVLVPPSTEQRSITSFLSRETAKIDRLIEKKERLIELLKEKRTALISHAVTKGLDPNVPMKDSGIEWLGKIPAHWEVRRLKRLATINDEVLPETTDPNFEISYVDIGSVDSTDGIAHRETFVFANAPSRARRIVRHGDVIVSTVRTYLRAIAPIVHPEPNLIVSTGFAVIRPGARLATRFSAYALRSPYFVERVVANSVGVSYPAINASELGAFPIAVPPEDEQRTIADFLDRETGKIDALIGKIEEAIKLLKEYRTALISAAVTGKIDVRDATVSHD